MTENDMNINFETCNGVIHVVEKGDSLYSISRIYRVPLAAIIMANPYVNVYNMQPGEEICIPVPEEENPPENRDYRVMNGDDFGKVIGVLGLTPNELFAKNESLYNIKLPEGMLIRK